jgi:hypothetical protein
MFALRFGLFMLEYLPELYLSSEVYISRRDEGR